MPRIVPQSVVLEGPSGLLVPGMVISLKFETTDTRGVPVVTLFSNPASTADSNSPFTFSYTIKEGDSGMVTWSVDLGASGPDRVTFQFPDQDRIAGMSCMKSHIHVSHASES